RRTRRRRGRDTGGGWRSTAKPRFTSRSINLIRPTTSPKQSSTDFAKSQKNRTNIMSQLSFTPSGDLEVIPSKTSSNNDFDFLVGEWKIRNKKLKTRLNNCAHWLKFYPAPPFPKIPTRFPNTT